jgi:hypothetical protein
LIECQQNQTESTKEGTSNANSVIIQNPVGLEQTVLTINITIGQFWGAWLALKRVIEKDIPSSQQDVAFLMETMSYISDQAKDTNKNFNISMPFNRARALWFCCDITVKNKLYRNIYQQAAILEVQSYLAIELDKIVSMFTPPEVLIDG